MEQLEILIKKLISDPYFAITVESYDPLGNTARVLTNATNTALVRDYGSASEFFESLNANGFKKIGIIPKKQNGTVGDKINYKNCPNFERFVFEFSPKVEQPISPAVNMKPSVTDQQILPGLNMPGMSAAEQIYKTMDHQRLVQENHRLTAENEALRAKNSKKKKKLLQHEFSNAKQNSNNDLLKAAMPHLPQLMGLITGAAASPGQPGMAGTPPQNLSQVKSTAMQALQYMDDDLIADLFAAGNAMGTVQGFEEDFMALLQKHNLIPVEDVKS